MGTILAIDYGTKRMGLAISDIDAKFAMPIKILEVKTLALAFEKLKEIVEKYDVSTVVLGLPLNAQHEDTELSLEIRAFADRIKQEIGVEVETVNEFLSSSYAENSFKDINYKVKHIDSEVARNLLQEYLNYKNKNHG